MLNVNGQEDYITETRKKDTDCTIDVLVPVRLQYLALNELGKSKICSILMSNTC